MAVSNKAILDKMMKELQQAINVSQNERQLIKHIAHVHILCELILDQDHLETNTSSLAKERQVMLVDSLKTKQLNEKLSPTLLEDEDANGESIFDF